MGESVWRKSVSEPKALVGEIRGLVVAYLKQETVGPLKGLARYLAFGVAGSIFVASGSILILLGVLRTLQSETGSTFTGNLSWVPYLLTAAVAILSLAVVGVAIKRKPKKY